MTRRTLNGKELRTLAPPINSSANDFAIIYDGDAPRGYFTSDRAE